MTLKLEPFDSDRHHPKLVALLLYEADPLFNGLVFGPPDQGLGILYKILKEGTGYFSAPYLQCAVEDGQLIAVIVLIRARDIKELDRQSGSTFRRVMGTRAFLRKLPLFVRLSGLNGPPPSPESLCIHMISVRPDRRNQGTGSWLIGQVIRQSGGHPLYLYVGSTNKQAQNFYRRNEFHTATERTMNDRGKVYGLQTMVRLPE